MPGNAKADIKLGFFVGIGFVLLAVILMAAQAMLSRARSATG